MITARHDDVASTRTDASPTTAGAQILKMEKSYLIFSTSALL